MTVFLNSISGVLVILVMIALGFILAENGWFDDNATKLIARLVTQIALPAYMVVSITKDFTASELVELLPKVIYPAMLMIILFGISVIVTRIIHISATHRGLFEAMFFNSNTVFVGLPINVALFGNKSLPFVLVYYMANTTFFWTLGFWLIQRDGMGKVPIKPLESLKKIFSPPLLGFIVGIMLVALNLRLPKFLISDLTYVGGLTIPLSMIFIGIAISNAGLSRLRLNRDTVGIMFGRFVLAPALMTLLVSFASMPVLMKQVFILQSAMPVMTNAPIVSRLYNADYDYAAVMVTETTLVSLIVIPILMMLVQMVH